MSEPTGRGGVKTLAIRLPDELHAQLVLIASLEGQSLTDTIRQAVLEHIERKRGDGELAEHAAKALEEMEQEAQARKQALQALLGLSGQPTQARGRTRREGTAS
jgi:predicted DNA-binding protein